MGNATKESTTHIRIGISAASMSKAKCVISVTGDNALVDMKPRLLLHNAAASNSIQGTCTQGTFPDLRAFPPV